MKKSMLVLGALLLLCSAPAEAQFLKKLTKKLEKKMDDTGKKLEEKVDKKIDKMLDMGEDDPMDQGMPDDMIETSYPSDGEPSQMSYPDEMGMGTPTFEAYSKYDFVPGEALVAYEDFSEDAVGDFPQKWNTSASAEVVTLSTVEGNWMRIGQGAGVFTFDGLPSSLEEDFTLEFDFLFDFPADSYAFKRYFNVLFSPLEDPNTYMSDFTPGKEFVNVSFTNGSGSGRYVGFQRESAQPGMDLSTNKPHPFFSKSAPSGTPAHIAILKKGQRLKVYVNEDKVIDVPRAFLNDVAMKSFRFQSNISPADQHFYISNVKYAAGVATSERLFDNGSYQAHGITFESGSAQIKGESYATLKEIAQAINANGSSSYLIVGHTDSDGSDAINIPLSQERAQAVKQALISRFNVDASLLQTEGKGSMEPLSTENSPTAKAQNRRVEIKRI